jgi:ketol-acid reductoisomerase
MRFREDREAGNKKLTTEPEEDRRHRLTEANQGLRQAMEAIKRNEPKR